MDTKTCLKCGVLLDETNWPERRRINHHNICRDCWNAYSRDYYFKNSDRIIAASKNWNRNHKDRHILNTAMSMNRHPDVEMGKRVHRAHPEITIDVGRRKFLEHVKTIGEKCAQTFTPFDMDFSHASGAHPSGDMIDPTTVATADNLQFTTVDYNRLKGTKSDEQTKQQIWLIRMLDLHGIRCTLQSKITILTLSSLPMKTCPACQQEKLVSDFLMDQFSKKPDYVCSSCRLVWTREQMKKRAWSRHAFYSHVRRGIEISPSFTIEDIFARVLQVDYCEFCQMKLDFESNGGLVKNTTPTLDQKSQSQPLTRDNIQILCFNCQTMKSNFPEEQFFKSIAEMAKNLVFGTQSTVLDYVARMQMTGKLNPSIRVSDWYTGEAKSF